MTDTLIHPLPAPGPTPTYGHDTEAAARADLIAPHPSHGA